MITTHDLLDRIYPLINVTSVTTTIDGEVYRENPKVSTKLRDVIIRAGGIGHQNVNILQVGTFHVNCYARNLPGGFVDEKHLRATSDAVIVVLTDYLRGSDYLELEIENYTILPDENDANMSYGSLRVRYIIQGD